MNTFPRFLLAAALATAGVAHAGDLSVTVDNARARSGALMIAVVDAAGWDGKAAPVAATGRVADAEGKAVAFQFPGLKPGRYAVRVMHDENGNGKLDTNLMGMPIEGYGFSNNPTTMGRPTFDDAAFDVGADPASITVHLR